VVTGLAFAALTLAIITRHGAPFPIDLALHEWSVTHRPRALIAVARLLTATGGERPPYVAAAIFVGWLGCDATAGARRKLMTAAAAVLDVAVGEYALRRALAATILRPRPPLADWAVNAFGTDYSFPSGHATASAIAAGLLVWTAERAGARAATRWMAAGAVAWSFAVGVTRVYLGVHWPTDVLGGWLLASSWLAATVPLIDALARRDRVRT
jgi:undecaprenyl-diphosphatase